MNIPQVWDTCLQFEYDEEELCSGVERWLASYKGKEILDCACGTGFPSLRLMQRGYEVVCSDGSESMLAELRRKAKAMGLSVEPHCVQWSELEQTFGPKFGVVMCRGCSLIYASSWDQDRTYNGNIIEDALRNFYGILLPGGVLYVDITAEENLQRDGPLVTDYAEKMIDGRQVRLFETIETDKARRLRTWTPKVTIDGRKYTITRHSYYLPHDEFIGMLSCAGFEDIERQYIEGEHYAVFTARKIG